jgi:2-furoyl-CoA dehydrogenase FAD binding subunit
MKPAPFDYILAENAEQALAVLAQEGDAARVLAGGQSLVPMLNMRLARPGVVVDISHVADFHAIHAGGGAITVPAMARQADLLAYPHLADSHPLLAQALPWVGHPQTRAQGTVCGSLAHADPSAELPLMLTALDGTVTLRSRRGRRELPAADFFQGLMTTDCAADEMIEQVRFPARRPGAGYAFREFSRRDGDFAIVACAAVATADGIELTLGGVGDRPHRRVWDRLTGSTLDDALNEFAWQSGARDDQHASARLRRDLVRSLGRQTIEEALACAE